jgi:hypothetical protein
MIGDNHTPKSDAHWAPPAPSYDAPYGAGLGELAANLVTLEFALRVALYLYETPRAQRRLPSFKIANLDSWVSSWSSLSDAIEVYNEIQAVAGQPQIDAGIIDLRNAIAHGRITGGSSADPMTVTRSDLASRELVRASEKHVMTLDWIRAQTDRVSSAIRAVHERMSQLQE